jgi:hypothetical protein
MNDVGRVQWLYHHLHSGSGEDLAIGLGPFIEWKDGVQHLSRDGLRALHHAFTDHLFGRWRTADKAGVSFAHWCTTLETGTRADALQAMLNLTWASACGEVTETLAKLNHLCRYSTVNSSGVETIRATCSQDDDERAQLDPQQDTFVRLFLESIAKDSASLVGSRTERLEPVLKIVAKTLVDALSDGASRFLGPFERHGSRTSANENVAALARYVVMQVITEATNDNPGRPHPTPPAPRRLSMHL